MVLPLPLRLVGHLDASVPARNVLGASVTRPSARVRLALDHFDHRALIADTLRAHYRPVTEWPSPLWSMARSGAALLLGSDRLLATCWALTGR